jgi:acyl-CoA synthetase (AMP-forming)/AMP-acid ligase II
VLADCYAAAGYGVGHRVGLMLDNRPAAFLHWLALNRLGTSVVPLHSDLRLAELAYLMQHSGICLMVAAQEHVPKLRESSSECPVVGDGSPVPCASATTRNGAPRESSEMSRSVLK